MHSQFLTVKFLALAISLSSSAQTTPLSAGTDPSLQLGVVLCEFERNIGQLDGFGSRRQESRRLLPTLVASVTGLLDNGANPLAHSNCRMGARPIDLAVSISSFLADNSLLQAFIDRHIVIDSGAFTEALQSASTGSFPNTEMVRYILQFHSLTGDELETAMIIAVNMSYLLEREAHEILSIVLAVQPRPTPTMQHNETPWNLLIYSIYRGLEEPFTWSAEPNLDAKASLLRIISQMAEQCVGVGQLTFRTYPKSPEALKETKAQTRWSIAS